MRVEVTAADLASGQPKQCTRCPVALALRRQVPGARFVLVNDVTISVYADDREEPDVYPTPGVVADFIVEFDLGLKRKPFAFTLPVKEDGRADRGDAG